MEPQAITGTMPTRALPAGRRRSSAGIFYPNPASQRPHLKNNLNMTNQGKWAHSHVICAAIDVELGPNHKQEVVC